MSLVMDLGKRQETEKQSLEQLEREKATIKAAAAAIEAEEKTDPLNDELQAMRSVARTLEKLPRDAQERVITWLANRQPPRLGQGYNELAKASEGLVQRR